MGIHNEKSQGEGMIIRFNDRLVKFVRAIQVLGSFLNREDCCLSPVGAEWCIRIIPS